MKIRDTAVICLTVRHHASSWESVHSRKTYWDTKGIGEYWCTEIVGGKLAHLIVKKPCTTVVLASNEIKPILPLTSLSDRPIDGAVRYSPLLQV